MNHLAIPGPYSHEKQAGIVVSIVTVFIDLNLNDFDQLLDSLLMQTYPKWELILQDGGSDRREAIMLRSLADSRIRYACEADTGIYDALNKGIKRSKGNWVLCMGLDDRLHCRRTLEKAVFYLSQLSSSILACYGNVEFTGISDDFLDGQLYIGSLWLGSLMTGNISHQAIFYRGEYARSSQYSMICPIYADWLFNIVVWLQSGMAYIPIMVSMFRLGGASSRSHPVFRPTMCCSLKFWLGLDVPPLKAACWALRCRLAIEVERCRYRLIYRLPGVASWLGVGVSLQKKSGILRRIG